MKKESLKKKIYQYTAFFEVDENGGYTTTIPSLPGCVSEGETFEDALKNIKEAASLYLEVAKERKEIIPKDEKEIIVAPVSVRV